MILTANIEEATLLPPFVIDPVIDALLDRILAERASTAAMYVCAAGKYPCGQVFSERPTICPRCGTDHRRPD